GRRDIEIPFSCLIPLVLLFVFGVRSKDKHEELSFSTYIPARERRIYEKRLSRLCRTKSQQSVSEKIARNEGAFTIRHAES
ncbi:hypothetical protein GCK32_013499, partial [Trichostrongylus colubriformis]